MVALNKRNILVNIFKCKVCGENHQLNTFIDSPKPEVIGRITRGELNQSLNVIAKSIFIVDLAYGIFGCELSIKILDYDDELDLNIWIKIDAKKFMSKAEENDKKGKINLNGRLIGNIPFYDNEKNITVKVEIDLDEDESPQIIKIENEGELKNDFEKGINLTKLKEFLIKIYHS